MTYTIISNPPGGFSGKQETSQFDDEEVIIETNFRPQKNRLQPYVVIPQPITTTPPKPKNTTILKPTIIQNILGSNSNSNSIVQTSIYQSSLSISNINSKTIISNNAIGPNTNELIIPSIWNINTNTINVLKTNEVIELQIRFVCSTDTLGGAFELFLERVLTNYVIDKQEYSINIQEQDYTAMFKIVTTQDEVAAGIKIYIKPELGMTLSLSNIEFIFIKSEAV